MLALRESEKLSTLAERSATTLNKLRHIGRGVINAIDIIPPSGAHAYRGVGQLRVADIPRPTKPKHSMETMDMFLSVEGIKQPPEQPHTPHELTHQPLLTQPDKMVPPHKASWIEKKPSK